VREIRRAVAHMPEELKAEVEATLVEAARNVRPQDLRGLATLLLDQHRPEVRRGEDAEAFAHRSAFLNTVGDRSHFNVTGDVEGAAVIDAVLRPLMTKRDTEDLRTLPQLRYDALLEALHRLLDSDTLPDSGSGRPHVTVVADIHNLTPDSLGAASEGDGEDSGSPATDRPVRGPVWLSGPSGWSLISREALLEMCCDAKLAAAINAPGERLDLHREVRTVTPAQKRALTLRDGGCRVRGCHRPPEHCRAHHLDWWEHGGPTDINNLVLLCAYHHRAVHRRRWRIEGSPDQTLTFHSPTGNTHGDAKRQI
jgi:hypothetical protein